MTATESAATESDQGRPLPRVIAIANQKGGVGKTTTTINLGACLAEMGFRTLVVDLDPQGNASTGLGIENRGIETSMYHVIMHEVPLENCIEPSSVKNLFVAPASLDLAGAEIELVPAFSRENRLRRAVHAVLDDYDYVLIDCPPSLGLLTVNGLNAADEVLVPIQCEYYALEGLGQLLRNVDLVRRNLNPTLEVSTIVCVMYDARTKLADQVVKEVREHFGDKVLRTVVPRTVRLSEAPSFGQPIITFDSTSREAGSIEGDSPRLVDLPIDSIIPNQHQPRVHFDEESLAELTASIREIGVLQPVLVRPIGDSAYELVAGERRWRAARRAGLAVIPAIVRNTDDLGLVERALVENLHRQDLTPLEEAAAYQQLIEDFNLTHEQVANRVGKSRSAVTNTLRLMSLPPAIQHLLADGRLSAGHARALLATPDRTLQEQLARQAAAESWSVRMLEEVVRDRGETPSTVTRLPVRVPDGAGLTPATRLRAPGLLELEELLAEHLQTRVGVTMGAKRGRVVIDFADLEDLERIYHVMTTPPDSIA
jgi:ParB/RepB/Spo0J family partition protein